jgi:hypothetical protein
MTASQSIAGKPAPTGFSGVNTTFAALLNTVGAGLPAKASARTLKKGLLSVTRKR